MYLWHTDMYLRTTYYVITFSLFDQIRECVSFIKPKRLHTFTKVCFISLPLSHTSIAWLTGQSAICRDVPFVCWFLASQIRRLSHGEMGTTRKELPVFSSWKQIELYEWILRGTKVSREWKRCGMQFFRRPIISWHDRVGRYRYGATREFENGSYRSESTAHNFVWTNHYCGHPLTARARSTNPITW